MKTATITEQEKPARSIAELTQVGQKLEEDELLSIERKTFPQIFEMIKTNKFKDAKTIIGLIMAGERLGFQFA